MASKNRIIIRLVSSAGTGYFYTTQVNPKNREGGKLKLYKYDPRVRKKVFFEEKSIKK
jgi:large subunit ribosomal protein L33